MRNVILVLLLTTSFNYTFGQKIVKNEVDEFTGSIVKETSWERLNTKSGLYSWVRFRRINDMIYFDFKMAIGMGNKVYSVDKGEVLFLKFTDEEVVKISNSQYEITSRAGGAIDIRGSDGLGVHLICEINEEIFSNLKERKIAKIRVYTSIGYKEGEINKRRAENLKKLAELINE